MLCKVSKAILSGTLKAPPSKSQTMRAIIFASMAQGESKIYNYLLSPDTTAMITACRQFGAKIDISDNMLLITGVAGRPKQPDDIINAGNSGQVLRFVTAILALVEKPSVITGDHSVRCQRPMSPLITGLKALGADCFSLKDDGHAPVFVQGKITPGNLEVIGTDSQPVSALLIAASFLPGTTNIKVHNSGERPWLDLTLSWLDYFDIKYTNKEYQHFSVVGNNTIKGFDYHVPGDFSSISYPLVAAILTHSGLSITNIDMSDMQGDKELINILISMGAKISISNNIISVAGKQNLSAQDIDVNNVIDALPILAVIACFARGTSKLYNAEIARYKESDRLACITKELKAMGANITQNKDSLIINTSQLHGAQLSSHKDHRIALALMVAAMASDSESTIKDIGCIAKSYPEFILEMQQVGARICT